jgi:PAS domain S-box-containing protein
MKELITGSDFYKTIFERSNDALLILKNGKIVLCNQQAVDLFGYEKTDDLIGKTPWDISPETQEDGSQSKTLAMSEIEKARDGERQIFDWIHQKNDGTNFYTEISLSRFEIDGELFTQASVRDINKRKQLQFELTEAIKQAKSNAELKTNFLANMSHDIRNPLNAILGFSHILAEDESLSQDERKRYVSLTQSNEKMLLHLINDILDISKIEANKLVIHKREIRLNSLMEELYLSFQKQVKLRNNLRLILNKSIDDPEFIIQSDPDRIRQILSNLLSNAIKYTNEGHVEFGYTVKDTHQIEFYVKDSGIGIAREHMDEIFNRFSRESGTKTQNIKGTGLGLDISKRLAELLGGRLWAYSQEGKGSEFYFSVPVDHMKYNPNYKKKQAMKIGGVDSQDWSNYHILIADDDTINYELLRIILSKTNVKISKATNGQEAIDILEKDSSIDLMLLDIQMPVMNGYEAIKHIRRLKPDLPVIAQTAVNLEYNEETKKEEMFDDCISKPIDVKSLISKVRKFLIKP